MKPLTCEEIRRAVHGQWLACGESVTACGVSTDSRTVKRGEVFFAVCGQRFDGHDYLPQAVAAGAVAAVVQKDCLQAKGLSPIPPGGVIGVPDTTRALGDLAAHHRGLCPAKVIAVTGSNGKTTVKRMIHQILRRRCTGTCGPSSFNNSIGVPLTLLGAQAGDDYVICEVGTNAPGEVAALGRICRPSIAVITSVGPAHLERLGSLEGVAVEKASLAGELDAGGMAIVCGDVPAPAAAAMDHALTAFARHVVRFRWSAAT
jgi:UDP-N-acetylmuramoyl-tripeptide--D-alanyl-D-alanine ligase